MTTSNPVRILSLAEARTLLVIYETMVETARSQDWERLAEIERQVATLRDTAIGRPSSSLNVENLGELTALLTRIQRLNHEVLSLVIPAHEHTRQQLAAEVKGRAVRDAYNNLETPGG